MRKALQIGVPVLVIPVVLFAVQAYPRISALVKERLPLLTFYYFEKQLQAEKEQIREWSGRLPPPYGQLVQHYGSVVDSPTFAELRALSANVPELRSAERILAAVVLYAWVLPMDFLSTDPVGNLGRAVRHTAHAEKRSSHRRNALIEREAFGYLRQALPPASGVPAQRPGLPPDVIREGLVFCGEQIPLHRSDVIRRIEHEIAYLLVDLYESATLWLKRKDRYCRIIEPMLEAEGLPAEFVIMPGLESGFRATALSRSHARGWWQFVSRTARHSQAMDPNLDWTLRIDRFRDDRCDLVLSTRAAARYLKWMRKRLEGAHGPTSWLTVAAAYNAGFNEAQYRIGAYGTSRYWDIKFALETERYVPRWIAAVVIDRHREYYGLHIPKIAPLEIDTIRNVQLEKNLPWGLLATLSECSVRFIREINSGISRSAKGFQARHENRYLTHVIHVPNGCRNRVHTELIRRNYIRKRAVGAPTADVRPYGDSKPERGVLRATRYVTSRSDSEG